jgi:hypothetical protein
MRTMEIKKRRPRKGGAGVDGPKRKHCIAFQGCHFFSRGRDAQKSNSSLSLVVVQIAEVVLQSACVFSVIIAMKMPKKIVPDSLAKSHLESP